MLPANSILLHTNELRLLPNIQCFPNFSQSACADFSQFSKPGTSSTSSLKLSPDTLGTCALVIVLSFLSPPNSLWHSLQVFPILQITKNQDYTKFFFGLLKISIDTLLYMICIQQFEYIQTTDYHLTIKKNKPLIHVNNLDLKPLSQSHKVTHYMTEVIGHSQMTTLQKWKIAYWLPGVRDDLRKMAGVTL